MPDEAGTAADRESHAPQWAEAYRLFDGTYLSLDDLLASVAE